MERKKKKKETLELYAIKAWTEKEALSRSKRVQEAFPPSPRGQKLLAVGCSKQKGQRVAAPGSPRLLRSLLRLTSEDAVPTPATFATT